MNQTQEEIEAAKKAEADKAKTAEGQAALTAEKEAEAAKKAEKPEKMAPPVPDFSQLPQEEQEKILAGQSSQFKPVSTALGFSDLTVQLSAEEAATIREYAQQMNMDPVSYIKRAALKAPSTFYPGGPTNR